MDTKRYIWRPARFLIILGLVLVGVVGSSAVVGAGNSAQPDLAKGRSLISSSMDGVAVNAVAFRPLTAEEMRSAKPEPLLEVKGGSVYQAEPQGASAQETAGPAGFIAGGLPNSASPALKNGVSADTLAEPVDVTGVGTLGYGYPAPFTRYQIFTPYTQYPYVTVGRLFFHKAGDPAGTYRSCSASSIGNQAIWTAGHCVHAGNNSSAGWATNVVFVPAYKDGAAPLGQWPAGTLWTTGAWYAYGNPNGLRRDFGGAVLYLRNGLKISQVVGYLGFAWNYTYNLHWNDLGYPADPPFTGARLFTCEASFAYARTDLGGPGPAPQAIGCDLTGGSSGGPWIMKFSGGAGATNYVNGDNSHRRSTNPLEMFSPHYDDQAKTLRDCLVIGC